LAATFSETASRLSFSVSQPLGHKAHCGSDIDVIRRLSMRRPRFIAEHARNARGLLGRVIAFIMARETRSQNLWVMDALGIDRSEITSSTSGADMGAA